MSSSATGGNTAAFGLATETSPGMVSTGAQSFGGVKTFINGIQSPGAIPIGSVIPTCSHIIGAYNCTATTTADSQGFVLCNGQQIADATSPMNGQFMPDINGSDGTPVFLRGSTSPSNTKGGSDSFTISSTNLPTHTHGTGTLANATEAAHTHGVGTYANAAEAAHTHPASLTGNISAGAASLTGAIAGGSASLTGAVSSTAASNGTLGVAYTAQVLTAGAVDISHSHGDHHHWSYPSAASGSNMITYAGATASASQGTIAGTPHALTDWQTISLGATSKSVTGASVTAGSATISGSVTGGTTTNGTLAVSHTAASNGTLAVSYTAPTNGTLAVSTSAGSSHNHPFSGTSAAGASHNHTISGSTDNGGFANTSISNIPKYISVKYIIRIK